MAVGFSSEKSRGRLERKGRERGSHASPQGDLFVRSRFPAPKVVRLIPPKRAPHLYCMLLVSAES